MRGVTEVPPVDRGVRFISTHTPHARRDHDGVDTDTTIETFLLTRLMRGVTFMREYQRLQELDFYSHASCEA